MVTPGVRQAVLAALTLLVCHTSFAAVTGQWDFNARNLAPTVGAALEYRGDTGASTLFTTTSIAGQTAQVMQFPATLPTQGFIMHHGAAANAGGSLVNRYTLLMDVMFPSSGSGQWRALLQTSEDNFDDGELFVNPNNGVGISGTYQGSVQPITWHRLAFVFDLSLASLRKYIDGNLVGSQTLGGGVDGRWALRPVALLFADNDNETASGFVNSIQIHDRALSAAEIGALGGATAAGLSTPGVPAFELVAPNGGEMLTAGNNFTIRWTSTAAVGNVRIDLYRGDTLVSSLAEVPLANLHYDWAISPFLGDGTAYRIRLTSSIRSDLVDQTDTPFIIQGSTGGNPNYGRPLQVNGGFENSLQNWNIIDGTPITLQNNNGKGAPHSGQRFFHGGLNNAGDAVVRQQINLLTEGFTAAELDANPVIGAEAYLRNWYGAGTFDDQVFYQVVFLDAMGEPLSSLRCIVAADNDWLQRPLLGLLPPGTRTLHLEVIGRHRRDLDNDSMADDIMVWLQAPSARPSPVITKLPMLQDVRQNAMALLWETDSNLAAHEVWWGTDPSTPNRLGLVDTLQIDGTHFVHRATIQPLQAQTQYYYKVRSGSAESPVFQFRSAPQADTPFRMIWFADNQNGPNILRQHMPRISARAPDLIAVAGDTVQTGNLIGEWHSQWFGPFEVMNVAQRIPVIWARGNHDGEHALAYAYSLLPGNESWFAFTFGNCRFIFLDSEADTFAAPEQLAWFDAELRRPETSQAAFRIACFHRPPFTDLWDSPGYIGEGFVRNDWVQLFEQFRVDIVVCGHAHAYERGQRNGVSYLIVGGGGGALDTVRSADWGIFNVLASKHHYNVMDVDGNMLHWTAYDLQNNVLDTFSLESRTPDGNAPAYVAFLVPSDGAGNVAANTTVEARLVDAQTQVVPASVELFVDQVKVAADVINEGNGIWLVRHQPASVFRSNTTHRASVTFLDSGGTRVQREWQFTIRPYPSIDLPPPLYFENFESVGEGQLPSGWSEANFTDRLAMVVDFDNPSSDAYLGWTVINRSRFENNPFAPRRLNVSFIIRNGQVVTSLANGNVAYAESDNRGGNQEQYLFSPDFDLTGHQNIFLSFSSIYEQNQDSMGAVEYSIDRGQTWLPCIYMLEASDIRRAGRRIDAIATLTAPQFDSAFGRPFGDFIGAPISDALSPYISPRVDDDATESKRIELISLPQAANQPAVRFRFAQAGTASWYFAIDDFGLYEIPPWFGQPIELTLERSGDWVVLRWTGGLGRYQLQRAQFLGGAWDDLGGETTSTSVELPADGAVQFYRVIEVQ